MERLYLTHINIIMFPFSLKIHFLSVSLLLGKFNNVLSQAPNEIYLLLMLNWNQQHFDVIVCSLCVNLPCWTFPALCKHYKVLSKCKAYNFVTNRQKCTILLQTCVVNVFYFERHITVKSSTNPFSVPFSSPVCLLVIPLLFRVVSLHIAVSHCIALSPWLHRRRQHQGQIEKQKPCCTKNGNHFLFLGQKKNGGGFKQNLISYWVGRRSYSEVNSLHILSQDRAQKSDLVVFVCKLILEHHSSVSKAW